MSQESIQEFREWIAAQGLDAFYITQPQNASYLSGWLNDEAGAIAVLVSANKQILFTNLLFAEIARKTATGWDVQTPSGRDFSLGIAEVARQEGLHKIGFEANEISYSGYVQLYSASKGIFTLQPYSSSIVETLRYVKQPHEMELLRKAFEITDATFAHLREWIQPGVTEKAVAWEIYSTMVKLGAETPSFPSIVASGPNGSMPHAVPTDRQIQRGELVTIDMGARYHGYCADMTRTISLGEPAEPRMREVYETVLRSAKVCEQGLHAGLNGREADALARDVLVKAGLGEYYVHSTGHGVGLQIHEGPNLSQRAPESVKLPAGTIVTVEPGVYIPGWTGCRFEDSVLLKEDGVEILTKSPSELVISR